MIHSRKVAVFFMLLKEFKKQLLYFLLKTLLNIFLPSLRILWELISQVPILFAALVDCFDCISIVCLGASITDFKFACCFYLSWISNAMITFLLDVQEKERDYSYQDLQDLYNKAYGMCSCNFFIRVFEEELKIHT